MAVAVVVFVMMPGMTDAASGDASAAETSDAATRQRLGEALEADLAANPTVPGEAIAVRAPGLDVTAATGLADVGGENPLQAETPFRIASVTKTFVAAATLRLVEQGKLRLDDPISDYLSAESVMVLRADGYRTGKITVRQLLRHSAGLFDYAASDAYDDVNVSDPGHRWTRAEQLRFATTHGDPLGDPGEVFHYSDTGYLLLGEIIERVTDESLAAAVRRLIGFRKLGLDHTYWETFEEPPAGQAPRAHQYFG
ncbi:MAG: serine hydrolase domain-containing protein, partial [Acidimicrobiia bacterium]